MSAHRCLLTLILLPLLIVFTACGEAEEELDAESPTADSSRTASPESTVDGTPTTGVVPADWETYTDPDYGFSIRYPPRFTVDDLSDPTSALAQRVLQFKAQDDGGGFALVVAGNTEQLSPEEWAREYSTCALERNPDVSAITIDGREGIACLGEPIEGKFENVAVIPLDDGVFYVTSTLSDAEWQDVLAGVSLP